LHDHDANIPFAVDLPFAWVFVAVELVSAVMWLVHEVEYIAYHDFV
jgi:hypothetical protein